MAELLTWAQINDVVEGRAATILPNQHLGIWSPSLNQYADTGLRVTPLDDQNFTKYFILTEKPTLPTAVTKTGGWASQEELDKALLAAGWSRDPMSVTEAKPWQWMASYALENVQDGLGNGGDTLKFRQKYSYSNTLIYNNLAKSPSIVVNKDTNIITITNADGTVVQTQFPTLSELHDVRALVDSLQKQVDKAVYSYEGVNEPTMLNAPVTDWIDGVTEASTKAEIFRTHINDSYYYLGKEPNVAYRFGLNPGGSVRNPADYGWHIVEDTALANAIGKIAALAGTTVKIWTQQPGDRDSYKVGDLWLYKDPITQTYIYKHCIKANSAPFAYNASDWVQPFATIEEVVQLKDQLKTLSSSLQTANNNIIDLQKVTKDIKDVVVPGVVTEQKKQEFRSLQKQIDSEQAQISSNVGYINSSPYFTNKDAFTVIADKLLAGGGSIDKLQAAINTAIADNTITTAEVNDVNTAWTTYLADLNALQTAIKDAKTEIDKQIPQSVQVGRYNLLKGTTDAEVSGVTSSAVNSLVSYIYIIDDVLLANQQYTLSFWYKGDNGVEKANYNYLYGSDGLGNWSIGSIDVISDGQWHKINYTFTLPNKDRKGRLGIAFDGRLNTSVAGKNVSVKSVALHEGNVSLPWNLSQSEEIAKIEKSIADAKSESKIAWEAYAKAQAEQARITAEANADGKITAEEKARIDAINETLRLAKEYAEAQDALLKKQQEAYADGKISTAEANAIKVAETKANLAEENAKAYADGIVTAEEKARIESAQKAYDDAVAKANEMDSLLQIGGRNILRKPESETKKSVHKEITIDDNGNIEWNQLTDGTEPCYFYLWKQLEQGQNYILQFKSNVPRALLRSAIYHKTSKSSRTTIITEKPLSDGYTQYYMSWSPLAVEPANGLLAFYGNNPDGNTYNYYDFKLEEGTLPTMYTEASEDIEARLKKQLDEINANPPRINPTTKNWEVYKFVDGVGKYVDTGDTSVGDNGKAPEIRDGYWWIFNGIAYVNSNIKAQGENGMGVRPNLLPFDNLIKTSGVIQNAGNTVANGKVIVPSKNIPNTYAIPCYQPTHGCDLTPIGGDTKGKTLIYSYKATNKTNVNLIIGNHVYNDASRLVEVKPNETVTRYMVRSDGYQYILMQTARIVNDTTAITGEVEFFDFKVDKPLEGEPQLPTAFIPFGTDMIGKDGYTPVKGTDYFDGKDGQDGKSSYLFVRYSVNADGSGMTTNPTSAKYIGFATSESPSAPTANTSYKWTLIKGTDGTPGETGADGKTSYLHIKYSNDGGVTFTANAGESVGEWIGTYTDFVQADATVVTAYTWNKVKGEDGADGQDAISVSYTIQGDFRVSLQPFDENGALLPAPRKVPYVHGGVMVGTEEMVQITVTVLKGVRDVTDKAAAIGYWMLNGAKVQVGGKVLNVSAKEHADGKNDRFAFGFDTEKSINW